MSYVILRSIQAAFDDSRCSTSNTEYAILKKEKSQNAHTKYGTQTIGQIKTQPLNVSGPV
jgi:hypothetical protein